MRSSLPALTALLLPTVLAAQAPATSARYLAARIAWEEGKYVAAIDSFARLLREPGGAAWRDSVALLTGELHPATELTRDGLRAVFSADGQFAAFETGPAAQRLTRIVRATEGAPVIGEVPGTLPALSPKGALVATVVGNAAPRSVAVRASAGGAEVPVRGLEGWGVAAAVFGADEGTLFVVASQAQGNRNEILRLVREGDAFVNRGPVAPADGWKGAPLVAPGGRWLVHGIPTGNPIGANALPAAIRAAAAFAVVDLQNGTSRRIAGTSAALSADGSTLVYLVRDGAETRIMAEPVAGGAATVVKRSTDRLDWPAPSPDGKRIAFQWMPLHDWELVVIDRDGRNETRLTREIQHDLMPRWLDDTRILAVMGEARHRRSHLYDVRTLARTRLFHNNTVRTIAPEYEWTVSADGAKVLIQAERDGDTVSLERGLYLTDLGRTVGDDEVQARLASARAGETALRDKGIAAFQRIAPAVKGVTEAVSVPRIFGYEKALYDFDSKHITQPGNGKAIAWLTEAYRSFGYEPQQQWFDQAQALGGKTANVLAVLKGTENPELVYVVSSHFDSRAEGPGADDNTSGTAALLEAARVLAKHPQPATIIFASFTGEEAGLLGSREWVRRAVADSLKVVGALNNDMLGWTNDGRLDNTIRYSNPGIRDIQHAAAMQFSRMITYDALYYKSTDAAAYYDAWGDIVGGIGSYPVLGNPHYHQPHDMLEFENHQLIAEASRTTVATLMLLASSPSRIRGLAVEGTRLRWTPSPEKGVRRYLVTWGPAEAPERNRTTVSAPTATIPGLRPGMVVQVKGVNARGLEGWDWARLVVP